jgi:hypothetical protein
VASLAQDLNVAVNVFATLRKGRDVIDVNLRAEEVTATGGALDKADGPDRGTHSLTEASRSVIPTGNGLTALAVRLH